MRIPERAGALEAAAAGRVARVEARGGRLSTAVGGAAGRWEERRSWLLTLEDADGAWGQGECSPLPGYSAEDPAEVEAALARPPADPASAPPSARCAWTMATLDLEARRRGLSVAALLCPAPRARVPLSALLLGEPGPALVEEAAARVAEGYRTLKWKAGRAGRWPEERGAIAALRAAFPEIALRLDINRAWSRAEAAERLDNLASLEIALVEEPCPAPFPPSPVPLAADESLQSGAPLDALGPLSALVLKPMALGPERCRALAAEAEARGLGVLVTHLFDGPLALRFALELARALPGRLLPCGLAPHPGLAAWGFAAVPGIEAGFGAAAGPGLGLEKL